MTKRLSITLVQNAAGRDRQANLARIESLLGRSVRTNLVVLPEVFALRGSDEDYRGGAEPIPGPLTDCLSAWARRWNAWVLAGSVLERDGDAIFNTSVLIDEVGDVVATYRKIHLFEAHLDTGQVVREADLYSAGREPVLVDIDGWQCGLSICYDLRFPELYRYYAGYGAQALFIPSNFTQRTGKDHWEVLARARAIENQCFVVAPNQCGANPVTKVASYGHSIAVGPWGEVLGMLGDEEGILTVEIDPALLAETRKRVPALEHRRLEIR